LKKFSPHPPENHVVILDVMTLCNHLIIKTTLFGEGRETKKIQKVHNVIKIKNVPVQEFCPRLFQKIIFKEEFLLSADFLSIDNKYCKFL